MEQYLAVLVYRRHQGEIPTDALRFVTRCVLASSEDDARDQLEDDDVEASFAAYSDASPWRLSAIMAVDEVSDLQPGQELTGFIAEPDELLELG